MARYSCNNEMGGAITQDAITTSYKTQLALTAETTTLGVGRGFLYDVILGTAGTPADNSYVFDLSRVTAAGSGDDTVIPVQLDPADVAGRLTAAANHTGEPTYTASS